MTGVVCTRGRALALLTALMAALGVPAVAFAQAATFKVAFFNIQSGKGEPALAGRPVLFTDTSNCTDTTNPVNGWGTGFVQQHLVNAVGNDSKVVALGLAESWASVCGSPENVRQVLGWKARSSEHNGVALVARFGFAGPEEWQQLDTSLNTNAADTMWVLRRPVCLDEACTKSVNVFVSHWFADGTSKNTSYDRQAAGTAAFLQRAGGMMPHVLVGDLNVWDGATNACGQMPNNIGLQRLRDAGYSDAWLLLRGAAEGFTGMTNRAGCGAPEGYAWKRPDYVWTTKDLKPIAIDRFGIVTPGDAAPSDHYGLIAEFAVPGTEPPPSGGPAALASTTALPADIVLHAKNASAITGNWQLVDDAQAAGGTRIWNPDAGMAKLAAPLAAPVNYFQLTFHAEAGKPYRLWLRGRAERDYYGNDSVYVQFTNSVTETGAPVNQIGSTTAVWAGIEDGAGCGLAGWGWQDNGYGAGVLGPLVYFSTTGPQTIRIQQREDGISIDQVVLSSVQYLATSPGATKNDTSILPATVYPPVSTAPAPVVEIAFAAATTTATAGTWRLMADSTAAGGIAIANPDAGAAKITTALTAPANYVEFTFTADAGRPYRLWLRGRADRNHYANDSVFAQFSTSVDGAGVPVTRIGTTDALVVNLEECGGCGVSGWGWQDTGYGAGVLGPLVTFGTGGTQTMRLQTREDGFRIDQVVLSAGHYLATAPGSLKDDTTILTAPAPEPLPAPGAPVTIRVLQWNLHHGVGTDGVYNLERIATWMAAMTPDVVMLNEVEKYTSWGNENQPERYRAMLEARTGRRWYAVFTQEYGNWSANGKGHQILSTFPIEITDQALLSYTRVIGDANITVNGRNLTVSVTHLDPDSQAYRLAQARDVINWESAKPENRIVTGDFNAWPDQASILEMNKYYRDTWTEATGIGKAITFAGNSPVGATKNGRIDYIFLSRGAADVSVLASQVYDTRDANGVMPSDHRPVVTTFQVR